MGKIELCYDGKIPESQVFKLYKSVELVNVATLNDQKNDQKDDWVNMLIYGDSREILRTLIDRKNVVRNVTLVYVDPPYGTGNVFRLRRTVSQSDSDRIAYKDFKFGSDYLEFLRHNFIFIRELLSENGSLYVHIGLNTLHYVKVILDEIFGRDNFVNDIARVKSNPKNFKRRAYGNIRDSILFYVKNPRKNIWNDPREPFTDEDIKRLFPKIDENGRRYTTVPLHAPGETKNGATNKEWRGIRPPKGRHWMYPPSILDELDKQGKIVWSKNGVPRLKLYANEKIKEGKKMQDVWLNFKDPQYPNYPTQKNLDMIKTIIEASSNPGDIVLDSFCGSGTVAVASEILNRRWICIDNSIESIKITLYRLIKVQRRPFAIYTTPENIELIKDIIDNTNIFK